METRAHHILVGAFTIIVVAAAMLFALWLAKSSISRQYDYYDIIFTEAVTGLSQGGMVQYNGIRVGDVDELRLDPQDPSKVLVRIRVAADTPVKIDTRAKLGLTGLTGVSFIQLTGGSPDTPLLKDRSDKLVPRIQADDSALSKLLAGSEDLVTKVNDIITRASELLSGENVASISEILAHLDDTTGAIAAEREDVRRLVRNLADASGQLERTLDRATHLLDSGNRLLDEHGERLAGDAGATLQSLREAATQLDTLLRDNRGALESGANGLGQIGPALRDLRHTLRSLQSITRRLEDDPTGYFFGGEHPREFTPQ